MNDVDQAAAVYRASINLEDSETLDEYHMLIEDTSWCRRCADQFELGESVVWVPAAMAVVENQIEALHRDCAALEKYPRVS